MTINHDVYDAFGASSGNALTLRDVETKRFPYVLATAAEAQSMDLTGIDLYAFILGSTVFAYDSTDTTTAHDGVSCLVTSDGKRFKAEALLGQMLYVDDRDTGAQPGSPTVGDRYLLPVSPTGTDWSSKAKHIARYTAAGWLFEAPKTGQKLYLTDESGFVHYDGSAWQDGAGTLDIIDGSITRMKLEKPSAFIVEAEQATPPGSPSSGVHYIVGASATGAWAGEDGNVARYTGSAWEFITALEGMSAFDKNRGHQVYYKSGTWQVDRPAGLVLYSAAYSSAAKPSLSGTYATVLTFAAHANDDSDNVIVVNASISISQPTGSVSNITFGLFVDSEASARSEVIYDVTANGQYCFGVILRAVISDTSSHDYYVKCRVGVGSGTGEGGCGEIMEISA